MADFLADWPEAQQSPVGNNAFDEALLLTGGEDVRMFLARKEHVVFSVWVNFPADLGGHIDDFATVMVTFL